MSKTKKTQNKTSDQDNRVDQIKQNQKLKVKPFSNWVIAGSGNFQKTKKDGRYRENCNTYRDSKTCKNHPIKSLKVILNHCGKLDCCTCFIHTASRRAKEIDERLMAFKEEAEKRGVNVGSVIHLVLVPPKDEILEVMRDYAKFLKYRREIIEKMLRECGIFASVIFTNIWSKKCEICGKEANKCECDEEKLMWDVNIHFHVLGFGYMTNTTEFRRLYPRWLVVNLGRRKGAYKTAFYLLTHVSLWRKPNGYLKPAYKYANFLSYNKMKVLWQKVIYKKDECENCKEQYRLIVDGVDVEGDLPKFAGNYSFLEKAKKLGVRTKELSIPQIKRRMNRCVYRDGNFKIKLNKKKLKLGCTVYYKVIVRKYQIQDVEELRKIAKENRKKYRKDLREKRKKLLLIS